MNMSSSDAIFSIFGLGVSAEIITMWGIMLLVAVLSFAVTRRLKDRPGTVQNAMEMAVEKLEGFFSGLLGKKKTEMYLPFFGSLFIFIIISNYTGLIPGSGIIKGFSAPTSSLSVTVGLSLIVFFTTHYLGVKTNGVLGYAKHFVKPVFFMLPFLIVDEIVRPLSLSLRLYGNIFGDESVTKELYKLLPIGAPLIMMVLSLLFCAIQAIVFTMLAALYIEGATGSGH